MEATRQLFKEILTETLSKRYLAELHSADETDAASSLHYRKMGKILSHPISKRGLPISIRRRAVIAVILAAALLILAGCGTVIYKSAREIRKYFGKDYFCLRFHITEIKGEIHETYALTYVPEGYELWYEDVAADYHEWSYKKNSREFLEFSQCAPTTEYFGPVLDMGEYHDFTHNGVEYYYTDYSENSGFKMLYWQSESYVFKIKTIVNFSQEELLRIIDGVQLVEE